MPDSGHRLIVVASIVGLVATFAMYNMYKIRATSAATSDFTPKVFVNIDDYVGVKSSAVAIHENQSGTPYMTEERVSGMAHFRGDQAKMARAEGFEAVRFSDGERPRPSSEGMKR